MQSTYSLSFGWDGWTASGTGCSRLARAVVLNNIGASQWFKSLDKRLTSYDWYVTLEHINHLTLLVYAF